MDDVRCEVALTRVRRGVENARMEHLGIDRPTDISPRGEPVNDAPALALPAGLARLLAERGEGVLCATLRLRIPGNAGHALITSQLAAARTSLEGTPAWLTLRSARGPRSVLLGEGLGSFLMLDPAPRDEGQPLWLLHRNGTSLEVGRDLEDLVRVIVAGAFHSVADHLLSLEMRKDPSVLGIPLQYDTRDEDSAGALLAALCSGDDDACDLAFEHFAGARSVGPCVVEARRVLTEAQLSDAALRTWTKTLDRMAQRNPVAVRVAEQGVPAMAPLLRHMEARGFLPGGEVHERVAHALEGTGLVQSLEPSHVDEALALEGLSAESREALLVALTKVRALDAYVLLKALQLRLVLEESAARPSLALEGLPSLASTWPAVLLGMGSTALHGAGPSCVRVLAHVDEPLIARVLEERLLACPQHFWNSAEDLAARLVVLRNPPTEARVAVWFDAVRAVGKTPKRFAEPESTKIFALLQQAVALDGVMEFFLREHNREPYAAVSAASRRGNTRLSRDLLLAVAQGTAPVHTRLRAVTLAAEWGDARAAAALAAIEKSLESLRRKGDRM